MFLGIPLKASQLKKPRRQAMESKEERLLRAIFGNEPQAKAIKFFMNLDELTVDVSIRG